MTRALFVIAIIVTGCKRPPDAPNDLDALCGYLYAHALDEDPAELEAGLDNLAAWLDTQLDETLEGYTVSNLDQDTVDNLDEQTRDLDGLVGAAVGSESLHSAEDLLLALSIEDPMEVFPDAYEIYERTYVTDSDCFSDRSCDTLEVINYQTVNYPLGLQVTSESTGQYRWAEPSIGLSGIQRTWMNGPATVNVEWLDVEEQYYLNTFIPLGETTIRLQATWVIAEVSSSDVPENLALTTVVSTMQAWSEDLDAYLD
ncbi:MAG: hypothetical protein QGG40_16850 [Myxococcota bacterium]|nr:hypothetical protein [Myxococcota bacterium]